MRNAMVCLLGLVAVLGSGCARGGGRRPLPPVGTDAGPPVAVDAAPGFTPDAGPAVVLPDAREPLLPGSLEVVSGDRQLLVEREGSAAPLVVRAVDDRGEPVPGARVRFVQASGDPAVNLSASVVVTDANGLASVTLRGAEVPDDRSWVSSRIHAVRDDGQGELELLVTTAALPAGLRLMPIAVLEEPASRDVGRTAARAILDRAIRIRLTAQSGPQAYAPIPDVAVRVEAEPGSAMTLECGPPPVVTGPDGVATCSLIAVGPPGDYRFSLVVGESIRFDGVRIGIEP